MEVVWTKTADRDLGQVYGYLEQRSLRPARGVLRQVFKAVDALVEMPRMGRMAELDLEREYRELVVDHLKIFYFVDAPRIVIVRLWDTRQDPASFFIPPEDPPPS